MRIRFVTKPYRGVGNTFGYSALVDALYRELPAAGVTFDEAAEIALHVEPPILYRKIPGTFSIAYTMWESEREFPLCFREHLHEADLIVVPSRWNVPIFQRVTNAPVVVCPLGVDADTYRHVPRAFPPTGTPFQWLFVGAPNARKGYDSVQATWRHYFYGRPQFHLYFKSSGEPVPAEAWGAEGWTPTAEPQVWTYNNITLDMRRLPTDDLRQLYERSHGFLYPTGGEGYGLTLIEALATGLPAVATDFGGHLDFVSRDTCTLLPWVPVPSYLETGITGTADYKNKLTSAFVHPKDLANGMCDVMLRYRRALSQARQASRDVRRLTWARSATRLRHIIADSTGTRAADRAA